VNKNNVNPNIIPINRIGRFLDAIPNTINPNAKTKKRIVKNVNEFEVVCDRGAPSGVIYNAKVECP
jgi:hypothetical protein